MAVKAAAPQAPNFSAEIAARERALGLKPASATLGIGQVHADNKAAYPAYMTARRGLMLKYYAALSDPRKGDAAAIQKQMSDKDYAMLAPAPKPVEVSHASACGDAATDYDRANCALQAAELAPPPLVAAVPPPPAPVAAAPKKSLWDSFVASAKKFDLSPSSEFAQHLSHGDFAGSDFIQDDRKMKKLQDGVVIVTAGAVLTIGTGGAAAAGAGALAQGFGLGATGTFLATGAGAGVGAGVGVRATVGTLSGKPAGEVARDALNPKAMAVDAALGVASAGAGLLIRHGATAVRGAVAAKSNPLLSASGPGALRDIELANSARAAKDTASNAAAARATLARLDAHAAANQLEADALAAAQKARATANAAAGKDALARLDAAAAANQLEADALAAAQKARAAANAAAGKDALARLDATH